MSDRRGGTIAVVTGPATGIGRAVADRFDAEGWIVYRFGIGLGPGLRSVHGDVRSADDWAALMERIALDVGRLDVLVNNAGILREAPLGDTSLESWNEVLAVNLTGAFLGCRAALPLLRQGDSPVILNFGSIDALRGSVGHSAYAASKGGIVALTRALALELSAEGIRVNAICPGTVDTPMVRTLLQEVTGLNRDRNALHPLGRISTPEEQAAAAVFLCSREASFITGVALSVDGGRAIR